MKRPLNGGDFVAPLLLAGTFACGLALTPKWTSTVPLGDVAVADETAPEEGAVTPPQSDAAPNAATPAPDAKSKPLSYYGYYGYNPYYGYGGYYGYNPYYGYGSYYGYNPYYGYGGGYYGYHGYHSPQPNDDGQSQ